MVLSPCCSTEESGSRRSTDEVPEMSPDKLEQILRQCDPLGPFPPAVAKRLLLSAPAAAIAWPV